MFVNDRPRGVPGDGATHTQWTAERYRWSCIRRGQNHLHDYKLCGQVGYLPYIQCAVIVNVSELKSSQMDLRLEIKIIVDSFQLTTSSLNHRRFKHISADY